MVLKRGQKAGWVNLQDFGSVNDCACFAQWPHPVSLWGVNGLVGPRLQTLQDDVARLNLCWAYASLVEDHDVSL